MRQPDDLKRAAGFVLSGKPDRRNADRRGAVERRLAAVMGLDVVGYSQMMAVDEEGTHQRVGQALEHVVRAIKRSDGRLFSFAGDGLMAEFLSAIAAVRCGLRIQAEALEHNAAMPPESRIQFRIGINSGEIVVQSGRAGGHAVNIAARLEQIGEPGAVCLSALVHEQVATVVPGDYRALGRQTLKNIPEAVSAYMLNPTSPARSPGGHRPPPELRTPEEEYRPSLAVMPFRILRPDQDDAYFAAGMVDDTVHTLSGLRDLVVISRSSTWGLTGPPLDPVRIGQELGVDYLLHGSVHRIGHRLRISAELCETDVGAVLWSDRFQGEDADLFALQDQIAIRVAGTIAPQVRDRQLRLAMRKRPDSMTAYDLVLQAMDIFYRLESETFDRASALLQQAIAVDPGYAPAWSNLAQWHITRVGQGWSPDVTADSQAASHAATEALKRDGRDSQSLAIHGHTQSYLFKNYDRAVDLLDRALVVGPNCALAWCLASVTSGFVGDVGTAIRRAKHALRLSPLAPDIYWYETVLAQAYYLDGRYADAVALGSRVFDSNIGHTAALRMLIASLVAAGDLPQARSVAARLMEVAPDFRLEAFRQQTPLQGKVRDTFIERLRLGGLPD